MTLLYFKSIRKNIEYILISIFLKLSLDALYVFGTSVFYSYLGRELQFNVVKYFLGCIAFLFFLSLIEKIKIDRIRFMIKCIFMLSGFSNMSVYGLRNYENSYFIIVVLFWTLLICSCICLSYIKQLGFLKKEEQVEENTFSYKDELLLFLGLIITAFEVSKFGLNISSFTDIYYARESFRSQNLSLIDSYLLSWNGTVILPWCFLVTFKRKKYLKTIITTLLAIIMFLINGLKTWLLLYVGIIVFSVLLRKNRTFDSSLNIVSLVLGGSILSGLLYFEETSNYQILGLLDRALILPGEINYYYLDFFSNNELLLLKESIFKFFDSSPYNPLSAVQISKIYMPAAFYHNATNGLIGDYYGNFGILGILAYPVLITSCFIILNYMLRGYDKDISAVVIFILIWLLINTSFFTWLMTGGFFIYIVILGFYKKQGLGCYSCSKEEK